jgi:hypothetical protein
VSRSDEIVELPNGWTQHITRRKSGGPGRGTSRTLKLVDSNGMTREVWHEAFSAAGALYHRHLIYQRPEE